MKILVFGATGSVGVHLVRQSLAKGHRVTAFVRAPGKWKREHPHLRLEQGDVLHDTHRIATALRGQDAVLVALGDGRQGGVRSTGTRNIVTEMERTDVRRFICLTTLGTGDSFSNLNWKYRLLFRLPLRKVLADHQRQETLIRQSQLEWTIVRAGAFTDGPLSGTYRHGFGKRASGLSLKISRADVADFMLKQLANQQYLHRAPGVSY